LSCLSGRLVAQSVVLDYRYVVIQLSTEDSKSSNRQFKAVDTSLSALVRCNSRLTTFGGSGDSNTYSQAPGSTPTPAPTATPTPDPNANPTPTPGPTATPNTKKPKSAKKTA